MKHDSPHLFIRLDFSESSAFGPGKADLLEAIASVGSIAGASRCMGMSYKKTRVLLDELNGLFEGPCVATEIGGKSHGGARLTKIGEEILDRYRRIQQQARSAVAEDLAGVARLLRKAAETAASANLVDET